MAYDLEAEMVQQQRKRIAYARIILKNMHRHASSPNAAAHLKRKRSAHCAPLKIGKRCASHNS